MRVVLETPEEFLSLIWQEVAGTRFLTPGGPRTLRDVARRLIADGRTFTELAAAERRHDLYPEAFESFRHLGPFDWAEFGELSLRSTLPSERAQSPKGTFYIDDGNHRSLLLAERLVRGAEAYRPIAATLRSIEERVKPEPPLPDLASCRGGAAAAHHASETLLRGAEGAAAAGAFGPACALTVLAIEESVKARVNMAIGLHHLSHAPPGFTAREANQLLRRTHTLRHDLTIPQSLSMATLTRMLLGITTRQPIPPGVEADLQRMIWLREASDLKQQGFYSSLEPGGWADPSDFHESERTDARTHVATFIEATAIQLQAFSAAS